MRDFSKAINAGSGLMQALLEEHAEAIEKAFLRTDDSESYKVALSLKFKDDRGSVAVECDISFIESKIKDSAKTTVSDQAEIEFAQ